MAVSPSANELPALSPLGRVSLRRRNQLGNSKESLSISPKKNLKTANIASKSVRRRASPYLDIPVEDKKLSAKAKILIRAQEKSQTAGKESDSLNRKKKSRLKSSRGKDSRAGSLSPQKTPTKVTNRSGQTAESANATKIQRESLPVDQLEVSTISHSNSISIGAKNHNSPFNTNSPKKIRDSPSTIIQNILNDSFETRVKNILPGLWLSPSQTAASQAATKLVAKDSLIEFSSSKKLQYQVASSLSKNSNQGAKNDSLVSDSRASTPTQSPNKMNSFNIQETDSSNSTSKESFLLYTFRVPNLQNSVEPDSAAKISGANASDDLKSKLFPNIDTEYQRDEEMKISSSPIRLEEAETLRSLPPLPQTKKTRETEAFSPARGKKTVGFSDDIEQVSSPPPSSPPKINVPLRSILKSKASTGEAVVGENDFEDSPFWICGSVIQLPAGSEDNITLLARATKDLADPNFPNKFEAYTSLNNIIKINSTENNVKWVSDKCVDLLQYVYRDLSEKIDYSNPFATRTIIQALKLVSFFFTNNILNVKLPQNVTRNFVLLCCNMIQSTEISKGLTSMLLQLLRDQHLPSKVITPKTGEFILQAILNMKTFASASLTIERINTLGEYIKSNFTMLQKNLNVWLGFLLINLTDTTSALSHRIVQAASQLLSEVSKTFVNNKAFTFALFQLIHQPLSVAFSGISSQSQSQIDAESLKKDGRLISYICEKLRILAHQNGATVVMDIWFHLTLLLSRSGKEEGLENWDEIKLWVSVFKECYSLPNVVAKVHAIKSWRAITYSCLQSLDPLADFSKEQKKFSLVIYPFVCNLPDKTTPFEISLALHGLFLTTLYSFVNMATLLYNKTNLTLVDEVWFRIVDPIFNGIYFNKKASNKVSIMGAEILNRLINGTVTLKRPDLFRCLNVNPVNVNEINSLPPRWVYNRHSLLQRHLLSVFNIEGIDSLKKLGVFTNYLNCLRLSTSREMKQNGKVTDVSSDIPLLVLTFFDNVNVSNSMDFIFDLIIRLNDALGIGALIDDSDDARNSCYSIIGKIISSKQYSQKRLIELCKFISNTLGYKLQLPFYQDLLTFKNNVLRSFVMQRIGERNFSKTTSKEYVYLGVILTAATPEELKNDVIISLIGHLLNPIVEKHPIKAIESLKIENWNIQFFSSAIFQLIDLRDKYATPRNLQFQNVLRFLISNRFARGPPDESLKFIDALCVSGRKVEILKFAPTIVKGLISICSKSSEYRATVEVIAARVLAFYEDDEFGLSSFKGLVNLPDQVEPEVEHSSGNTESSTSADTFEIPLSNFQDMQSMELIMDDSQVLTSREHDDNSVQEQGSLPSHVDVTDEANKENYHPQADIVKEQKDDEIPDTQVIENTRKRPIEEVENEPESKRQTIEATTKDHEASNMSSVSMEDLIEVGATSTNMNEEKDDYIKMMHTVTEKMDIKTLTGEEKIELENDLLRFILKLRGI